MDLWTKCHVPHSADHTLIASHCGTCTVNSWTPVSQYKDSQKKSDFGMRGFDFFFSYKDFLGSVQLHHDWKLSIALRISLESCSNVLWIILVFLTKVQLKLMINFPKTKVNESWFHKKQQSYFSWSLYANTFQSFILPCNLISKFQPCSILRQMRKK